MAITKPPTKVRRTLLEDIATLAPVMWLLIKSRAR